MTTERMRAILRAEFGARRYRLEKSGEIHVSTGMRGGWYLLGFQDAPETLAQLERYEELQRSVK